MGRRGRLGQGREGWMRRGRVENGKEQIEADGQGWIRRVQRWMRRGKVED